MRTLLDEYQSQLVESGGKITTVQPANRSRGARIVVAVKRDDGSIYKAQVEFDPNGMVHSKSLSGNQKGDMGRMQLAVKLAKQYKKDHPDKLRFRG